MKLMKYENKPVSISVPAPKTGDWIIVEYSARRRTEYVSFRLAPKSWRTKDGKELYPHQMTDGHLTNTLLMIRDGRMGKQGRHVHKGKKIQWWARVFENELLHRLHVSLNGAD